MSAATSSQVSTLYKILGVARTADEKEIRDAYKSEVVKAHPDKGGSPQHFDMVQRAYETLRDKDKRRQYDSELMQQRRAKSFRRPPPLHHVKAPVPFVMQDGELYMFESAPDRLRCKFRHGDIVCSGGDTGCFLGMGAYDTLYWVKQGNDYATSLFSLGMGDEKHVHVVMRAGTGGASAAAQARRSSYSSSTYPPEPSATSPTYPSRPTADDDLTRKLKDEIIRQERLRLIEQRFKKLFQDESQRRQMAQDRIEESFRTNLEVFRDGLRALGWKPPPPPPISSPSSSSHLAQYGEVTSPVKDYINTKYTAPHVVGGPFQQPGVRTRSPIVSVFTPRSTGGGALRAKTPSSVTRSGSFSCASPNATAAPSPVPKREASPARKDSAAPNSASQRQPTPNTGARAPSKVSTPNGIRPTSPAVRKASVTPVNGARRVAPASSTEKFHSDPFAAFVNRPLGDSGRRLDASTAAPSRAPLQDTQNKGSPLLSTPLRRTSAATASSAMLKSPIASAPKVAPRATEAPLHSPTNHSPVPAAFSSGNRTFDVPIIRFRPSPAHQANTSSASPPAGRSVSLSSPAPTRKFSLDSPPSATAPLAAHRTTF